MKACFRVFSWNLKIYEQASEMIRGKDIDFKNRESHRNRLLV